MGALRSVLATQVRASRWVEYKLPEPWRRDGSQNYLETLVPAHLKPGLTVYDVGGGKQPYLTPAKKRDLRATVIGIDIDAVELARAPGGSYDRTITVDIAAFHGDQDADLIVCQAVFEHVADVAGATRSLATILKPGGTALIFVPCRNALFARVNLLMPERVKRAVLFTMFPHARQIQGFPSHYQHCTPSAMTRLAETHGLEIVELETFWTSAYFEVFFPAYLGGRLWSIAARALGLRDFCETFTMTLRKPA